MAKKNIGKKIEEPSFSIEKYIPSKYHNLFAVVLIVIIFLAYFSPIYFGGKTYQSTDIVTIKSMKTFVEKDRTGFSLWNPYLFYGMPAYATGTEFRWWDFIGGIYSYGKYLFGQLFSVDYAANTLNLILIALTSFFFMRSVGGGLFTSLFVGISTAFSTGILLFIMIGHITKMISLAAFPIILMMLLRFNKKIKLLDFVLMTAFMHFVVLGAHVQIIYYIFLTVGVYYLFYFAHYLIKKEKEQVKQLLKSAGAFAAAVVIAMSLSADSYASLWEYNPYSTRTAKSVLEQSGGKVQSDSEFYEYATNWSFSPQEIMTFVVPSYYGFGNVMYQGPLTNNQEVKVNTYFGQMPFVDVAMYMGIVVFILALLGIFLNWKKPFIRFLALVNVLYLIASFGRNFSFLFDFMFHYLPFFDKFRVPSMILTMMQMTFPILAGFAIMKVIELKNSGDIKIIKIIKNGMFFFAGLFIAVLLLSSPISTWFIGHIEAAGEKGTRYSQIYDFMASMFTTDLIINMLLATLTFGAAYLFLIKKISRELFVVGLILFTMIDLFRVGSRGTHYDDNEDFKNTFNMPDYISVIKEQKDTSPYRIVNFKQGALGSVQANSNFNVYFLEQDMSGYSAVKPRSYQDIMDVVGPVNPTLWRMTNVKYLAFDQEVPFEGFSKLYSAEKSFVYRNDQVLPRAFFVDTIATAEPIAILNAIKENKFDPKHKAFVTGEELKVDKPDSTSYVNIVDYDEASIKLDVKASGNNFLFLSDTYYPKGWSALIDGNETKIYRTNHGFRGIIVPVGEHKIEFIYSPDSFVYGRYASLGLNILLIGLFIFALVKEKKKTTESNA